MRDRVAMSFDLFDSLNIHGSDDRGTDGGQFDQLSHGINHGSVHRLFVFSLGLIYLSR